MQLIHEHRTKDQSVRSRSRSGFKISIYYHYTLLPVYNIVYKSFIEIIYKTFGNEREICCEKSPQSDTSTIQQWNVTLTLFPETNKESFLSFQYLLTYYSSHLYFYFIDINLPVCCLVAVCVVCGMVVSAVVLEGGGGGGSLESPLHYAYHKSCVTVHPRLWTLHDWYIHSKTLQIGPDNTRSSWISGEFTLVGVVASVCSPPLRWTAGVERRGICRCLSWDHGCN